MRIAFFFFQVLIQLKLLKRKLFACAIVSMEQCTIELKQFLRSSADVDIFIRVRLLCLIVRHKNDAIL